MNGARVSITDTATRQAASVSTNSEGEYTFAFLKPDEFAVEVEAKGFETMRFLLTVKVGQTTNGSAKVAVGEGSETVDVHASAS